MRRRPVIWILLMILSLGSVIPACAETGLEHFKVRGGNTESNMIAITMDDVNEPEYVWKTVELCRQYGIAVTFFPNGCNIHEEDADNWRDVVESGCEIGSHGYYHNSLRKMDSPWKLLYRLGYQQETLDRVLGYHYQIRWYRPPYGKIEDPSGSERNHVATLKKFGYEHAVLWNVSETDPDKAIKKVKNGSILLYHARKKDYNCLVKLIPMLLDAGFRPVTLSEMFGYDPPEISDELYVYNEDDYR